ncbi:Tetratricopeptide TPR_1 repeat-containing protein [Planoprotostelium fungivorum]|uniref:Tetratricopeptide TPR_1 repeat-containing protein n=1 Tax=Planoprotostelium fungivorum TaxID=1890364 RepID=A0A2P6NNL5_9EUKA|nr:Tetratricopeptide TPR_1 repeat-containing protein [Planoprotostelium fungivorum]
MQRLQRLVATGLPRTPCSRPPLMFNHLPRFTPTPIRGFRSSSRLFNDSKAFGQSLDKVIELTETGKLDEAMKYYDKLIDMSPGDAFSYLNRGLLHEVFSQWKSAIDDYTTAISLEPDSGAIYLKRGNVHCEMRNYKEALADFTKAISLDSKSVDAFFKRASCFLLMGKYKEALEDLDKTIELNPGHANAYNLRSICQHALGATDKAISDINKASEMKPNQFISYKSRAQMHETKGRLEEALQDWTSAISLEPKKADLYLSRGLLLKSLQRKEEAIRDFDKAIELDPSNAADAENQRAVCYRDIKIQKSDTELQQLTEAIEKNRQDSTAYVNRGIVYQWRGKRSEAIADYSQSIQVKPTREAHYRRGNLLYEMDRLADAEKDLTSAIELDPKHWQSYYLRAKIRDKLKEYEGAEHDYTMTIHSDSEKYEKAVAYNDRGLIRLLKGKFKEAVEDFTVATKLLPRSANSFFNRGNARRQQKEYEAAISDFNQAITIEPKHWESYKGRATCYQLLKDTEKALKDWDHVIQNKPDAASLFARAMILSEIGGTSNLERALDDFNRCIGLKPDYVQAYSNRGVTHNALGKTDDAIRDLNKKEIEGEEHLCAWGKTKLLLIENYIQATRIPLAIELEPKDQSLYTARSILHESKGNLKGAVEDLTKAIEMTPNRHAKLYFQRGFLKKQLGDNKGSSADYHHGQEIQAQKRFKRYM